jgi:DNA-binding PadR family transcriptional regulator
MMHRSREPTTLEFAILGLLALEPRSGYDLLNVFKTTAIGNYSSSPGAIYPALGRLEKRGLVDGAVDNTQALRPKRIFRPTAKGDDVLRRWLGGEITKNDVRRHLDQLMLRFAFHSMLEVEASRAFLRSLARKVGEYVAELQEQREMFPDDAPPHGRMAFDLGLEHYRVCGRWAQRALRHFEEKPR